MVVNVTVRDIVNFPGGNPKTVSIDIASIVPFGEEGDEKWVVTTTTTATASNGTGGQVSIQGVFKNQMKKGFIKSSGLTGNTYTVPIDHRMKVAIDEAVAGGTSQQVTLASGTNLPGEDLAKDLESKIRSLGVVGGTKGGNLGYLNAQVRFDNGKFSIESGTVASTFISTGRSSVQLGAPDTGTDGRSLLGFNITLDSETLASRQLVETPLTTAYSTGDLLFVQNASLLASGDPFIITDGTNSQMVLTSGVENGGTKIRFTTVSGQGTGLSKSYASGSLIRKLHTIDVSDPVSAISTVDQLVRSNIDTIVNQIDFSR